MKRDGEALPRPAVIGLLAGGRWRACVTGYAVLWSRGRLEHDGRGRVDRRGSAPRDGEPIERSLFNALLGSQGAREAANRGGVQRALREGRRELGRLRLRRSLPRRILVPLACLVVPAWVAARTGLPPVAGIVLVLVGTCAAVWFAWPRTARGERLLSELRRRHPLPATAPEAAGAQQAAQEQAAQEQAAQEQAAQEQAAQERAGQEQAGQEQAAQEPEAVGMLVALHGNAALHALLPGLARGARLYEGGRWSREYRHHGDHSIEPWADAAASDLDAGRP
ncbi:hypothetical protein GCM10007977_064910 [Dactylosporangium sucinum]|uniref:Uncharacterized protein n=1 Tax=Dactylosporangium sucinum TaxID=1424081 RepID=A0A917U4F3_9ACTN|nr:hypothetical protein GCM10007977_064910 [Dactylosporangium sucinum]